MPYCFKSRYCTFVRIEVGSFGYWRLALDENVTDDFGRNNARQFLIEPLESERKSFVVDSKLVENRCVQITNMNGIPC